MHVKTFLILCWVGIGNADLRIASHPRNGYGINQQGTTPFATGADVFHRYMIPSIFLYKGLKYPGGQKYNNYDNFLRSNIDNEQDNRDFDKDKGKDHLPFRTYETAVDVSYRTNRYDGAVRGPYDLRKTVKAGQSVLVPLRWNNPHSAEMEVNIWIFDHGGSQPVAIPIRKPTCSGEGHQDNAISFTVPGDFTKLGAKIPGFKGCNEDSKPLCTLQVYSHSVESRTYSLAFPIIIPGHDASLSTTVPGSIRGMSEDPWLDLSALRELCLATTDPSADIASASPRWARLVSDVYNHAYQNSDFSPYSGQQHELISRNLQASAVNKMVTGNRGELGRSILPAATYARLKKLQSLEDSIYKNYESIANKIINRIGNSMKTTGKLVAEGTTQPLANCFRCEEVGSTNTNRQETNTYIPSFQLPDSLVATARGMVSSKYSGLITPSGKVQIYVAALTDLLPFFFSSYSYGIIYQQAVLKTNLQAKPDATDFVKVDADGKIDKGVYASTMAKKEFASSLGCPSKCLWGSQGFKPLVNGATATSVTDECIKCTQLFLDYHLATPPRVTALGRAIVTGGLPAGFGDDQIADYPDTDGSPRVGRPATIGQSPVLPTNSTWELGPAAPTPPPTKPPAPTPAPTPVPPGGSTRRRRGSSRRRRRRSRNGDAKPSRRRSSRRRRRRRSDASLLGEPTEPAMQSNTSHGEAEPTEFELINRMLDEQTDDALNRVLGDIKPLPMADGCK